MIYGMELETGIRFSNIWLDYLKGSGAVFVKSNQEKIKLFKIDSNDLWSPRIIIPTYMLQKDKDTGNYINPELTILKSRRVLNIDDSISEQNLSNINYITVILLSLIFLNKNTDVIFFSISNKLDKLFKPKYIEAIKQYFINNDLIDEISFTYDKLTENDIEVQYIHSETTNSNLYIVNSSTFRKLFLGSLLPMLKLAFDDIESNKLLLLMFYPSINEMSEIYTHRYNDDDKAAFIKQFLKIKDIQQYLYELDKLVEQYRDSSGAIEYFKLFKDTKFQDIIRVFKELFEPLIGNPAFSKRMEPLIRIYYHLSTNSFDNYDGRLYASVKSNLVIPLFPYHQKFKPLLDVQGYNELVERYRNAPDVRYRYGDNVQIITNNDIYEIILQPFLNKILEWFINSKILEWKYNHIYQFGLGGVGMNLYILLMLLLQLYPNLNNNNENKQIRINYYDADAIEIHNLFRFLPIVTPQMFYGLYWSLYNRGEANLSKELLKFPNLTEDNKSIVKSIWKKATLKVFDWSTISKLYSENIVTNTAKILHILLEAMEREFNDHKYSIHDDSKIVNQIWEILEKVAIDTLYENLISKANFIGSHTNYPKYIKNIDLIYENNEYYVNRKSNIYIRSSKKQVNQSIIRYIINKYKDTDDRVLIIEAASSEIEQLLSNYVDRYPNIDIISIASDGINVYLRKPQSDISSRPTIDFYHNPINPKLFWKNLINVFLNQLVPIIFNV